jgi:anti-anti-sigma regulatory factor
MAPANTPLLDALERLKPPDHLCSIYETQEEQFAVAIPFIRIGLERGEKCIYIADAHNLEDVREALRAEVGDLEPAMRSGALELLTKEDAYMKRGHFDPDWMFTFWKEATDAALERGFSALRTAGETEWVQRGGPGLERWMEYESRLTHTLSQSKCVALCQYNRRVCSPAVILDVIRTHPLVIYGSTVCRNFYFVPADEFLAADSAASEVERVLSSIRERERLEGELRRANDELETRVEERTAELARANQDLAAQIRERQRAEQAVRSQQEAIRELSTPVLPIRDRMLIVPVIGSVDTTRARQLTEQVLRGIRAHRAKVVVIDVTGVATLDTVAANHLMLTAAAARLLGAHVILTGISSSIAQTLVTLGVDLTELTTMGDLQSGIEEGHKLLAEAGHAPGNSRAQAAAAGAERT